MNIIRYYNNNRMRIWIAIAIIVLVVLVIQFFNLLAKKDNNENKNQNKVISAEAYKNNISINQEIKNESVAEQSDLVIDQFIRFCNAGNIEQAYALLTDECKEKIFPSIEYFKNNYYSLNFRTQKLYSKTLYSGNTYKVKIYENILNSGSMSGDAIEDYYTIVKKDNGIKLNISNYIERKMINKTSKTDILKIEVVRKDVYSDYEEYEMKITNLTYKNILLDTRNSTKTMYLVGDNNVKYYSYSHELNQDNLLLRSMVTKTVTIKYSKSYNKSFYANSLSFTDIIKDYDEYQNNQKEYKNRDSINVSI